MSKLICPVGPQGSGKTTWAKQYMATHPNTYRVNGDEVRAMVYVGRWDGKKESVAQNCQAEMVESLLRNHMNVIWDNMNLSTTAKNRCETMAMLTGAELIWHKINTSIEDCIHNDRARGCTIGRAIIENTFLRYDLINWNDYRDLVIVDVDGTLTDCEWRRHLVSGENKDWAQFLLRSDEDELRMPIVRWVNALSLDYDIIIVSGRNETYYEHGGDTRAQLAPVNYQRIFMRGNGDHRHDWEVKNDILRHIPKGKIKFAIDDRPQVIEKTWRANGIKVYPVGGYETYW